MSHKSRRRLTLAAGAIVAGAAIPIAAAGIAWANVDDSLASLVAVGDGQPMEISFDGQVLIDTCNGDCLAVSGTDNDLAIAVGDGSVAEAIDGQGDKATASDGGLAEAVEGNDDTASATGYTDAEAGDGNGDSATANGDDAEALALYGNNDTATATGDDSYAEAAYGNYDSATVTDGDNTNAYAGGSQEVAAVSVGSNTGNYDTAIANGADSNAVAGVGFNHDYASASDGYTADADYANHLTIIEPPTLDPTAVVDPVGVIDPAAVVDPGAVDPAVFASLIP